MIKTNCQQQQSFKKRKQKLGLELKSEFAKKSSIPGIIKREDVRRRQAFADKKQEKAFEFDKHPTKDKPALEQKCQVEFNRTKEQTNDDDELINLHYFLQLR